MKTWTWGSDLDIHDGNVYNRRCPGPIHLAHKQDFWLKNLSVLQLLLPSVPQLMTADASQAELSSPLMELQLPVTVALACIR